MGAGWNGLIPASQQSSSCLMFYAELVCGLCGAEHDSSVLQTLCQRCGRPLLAKYHLEAVSKNLSKLELATRQSSLWRYRELLPLPPDREPVTLGEGWTPLLPLPALARRVGLERLLVKDESRNPTASFKARGMSVAVSMAKNFGVRALVAPSAGNAGSALAAYAARAGIDAHLFLPKDTPLANVIECRVMGAEVILVDGLITDCGREAARRSAAEGWFDLSTLKEPFRLEGKKTLGFELAEQLDWQLPDVIIYPTGGGTGLIGMWKAFDEMEKIGWIKSRRPKMVCVQASGCCPLVSAFKNGERFAAEQENAATKAFGLRVPKALGDFLILEAIRLSHGTAIAISDHAMIEAAMELGTTEGIFASPEGAACYAALKELRGSGWIQTNETTVIFNTSSGLKYLECFAGLK
jgi:threonine synthase